MDQLTLPDYLDPSLWAEWIAYRREDKKKPASLRSQRMTLNKLERLAAQGYDANRLIEHAIEQEWQGIYAHEDCKHGTRGETGRQDRRLSAVERFRVANGTAPYLRTVGDAG